MTLNYFCTLRDVKQRRMTRKVTKKKSIATKEEFSETKEKKPEGSLDSESLMNTVVTETEESFVQNGSIHSGEGLIQPGLFQPKITDDKLLERAEIFSHFLRRDTMNSLF